MGRGAKGVDIFLQAGQVLKSLNQRAIERDREGNPIVWIEASNPNPDIENEKLYAQTLLDAQGYFLSYGNITYDHLPKSAPHTGSVGYIGKPLEVRQKGNAVWVKCKLNRSNPIVKDILQKFKAGMEFVANLRASIGGRFNRRSVDVVGSDGAKILQGKFLWDEVAITYIPVNDTLQGISLGGMELQKSNATYSSPAFLIKSLHASGLTDLQAATGADALTKPSMGVANALIRQLQQLIRDGTIATKKEVIAFLKANGLNQKQIEKVLGGKMFGKKKGIKQRAEDIRKSLAPQNEDAADASKEAKSYTAQSLAREFSGGDPEIAQHLEKILTEEGKGKTPEELRQMVEQIAQEAGLQQGAEDQESEEEPEDDEEKPVQKSFGSPDDWEQTLEAMRKELGIDEMQETIKSLQKENQSLQKDNATMKNALSNVCEMVGGLGESVEKSLMRPAANEEAKALLRAAAAQAGQKAGENDDAALVQKSLNKHIESAQKFRGGTHEADEFLSAVNQHVSRGGALDNTVRAELQGFLGQ